MASYRITTGPSKWELGLSLVDEHAGRTVHESRRRVRFGLEPMAPSDDPTPVLCDLVVEQLSRVSIWSDARWNVLLRVLDDDSVLPYGSLWTGQYATTDRTGELRSM